MTLEVNESGRDSPGVGNPPNTRGLRRQNLRWVIVGVVALLAVTNYLDRGNLSVAAHVISVDLGLSNTQMGLILSAFVWPYAIVNLPAGWAVDRFGARWVMALAALLWSVAGAATGLARSAMSFVILRVALGSAEAPIFPAALKVVSEWFPDRERGRATSVYLASVQVGLAIAPPISAGLLVAFGWPMMFFLMGAVGLVGVALWLVVYRRPDQHPWLSKDELQYIREGQAAIPEEALDEETAPKQSWLGLFRFGTIWWMLLGAFCLQYVFWFYITWLPSYLQSEQHFSVAKSGLVSALPYIAAGIAVLLGGRISDYLVRRGVVPLVARRRVIAVGAILEAGALLGTVHSTTPAMAVALLTAGSFFYGLTSASFWTLPSDVVQTQSMVASVGSIQNFGGAIGGAIAPIATGVLIDQMGGFVPALVVGAVMLLVSAVAYGVFVRRPIPV
jgi:D-galactonate transporter